MRARLINTCLQDTRNGLRRVRRHFQFYLRHQYPEYEIGEFSYGGLRIIDLSGGGVFSMGKYCSVAKGAAVLLGGDHRIDWVSTYPLPALWPEAKSYVGHPASQGDVIVGNDVWIGRDALILSGVCIGDGAVVAARSVVTRDVPPYAIVAGNPARVIRLRFPDDFVASLLEIRWWDWPKERIAEALPFMLGDNVARFIESWQSESQG